MSTARGSDKSKTIRILFDNNSFVLKSLRESGDIRKIQSNKSVVDLRPRYYALITVTFSTVQQASEAIKHRVL